MTSMRSLFRFAAVGIVALGALSACGEREQTARPPAAAPAPPPATSGAAPPAASPAPAAPAASAATADVGEREFVERAAASGIAEVRVAELLVKNAAGNDIKQLGQRLLKDHTQANDELKRIAGAKNIKLPEQPADDKRSTIDELQKMKDAQLSRAALPKLEQWHQDSIALFERQAQAGAGELKTFAEKTLPTLREHLKMVQSTKVAAASAQQRPTTTASRK